MARRTVTVGLGADASGFKRGADQAERATKDLVDELLDAAKAGKTFGTAAAVASKQATAGFKLSEHAAKQLDDQIEEAARDLRRLGDEFKRTGDVRVFREFQKQYTETQKLIKSRSLFSGVVEDAAKDGIKAGKRFTSTFSDGFGALPAQLKGALIAGGAAAAVALAPLIAGAISAGVLAGLAGGSVAVGVALAVRDPKVQAEGERLGTFLLGELTDAARGFVPATIDAIRIVRAEFAKMKPDVRAIFDSAATFVVPLTRGITGLVREMLPGIRKAIESSGPVVASLEAGFQRMGRSVGDAMAIIAGGSESASIALDDLFATLDGATIATAKLFRGLTETYVVLKKTVGFDFGAELENPHKKLFKEIPERFRNAAGAASGFEKSLIGVGEQMLRYADAARDAADANHSAFDSQTRYGAALIAAKKAAKDGKDGIDEMTEAGQRNRGLLSELASATKTHVADLIKQHASQGTVNKAMNDGYAAFLKVADGMKIPRAQAVELARELGLIPKDTKADVHTNAPKEKKKVDAFHDAIDKLPWKKTTVFDAATEQAKKEVAAYKRQLDSIKRTITTSFNVDINGNATVFHGQRWGGITEHAQTGLLREANMFTPRSPARFAFAEPATGGEAFIPKFGDFNRSMAVLSRAAQWYGMQVTPASSRPQATFAPTINVYAVAGQSEHAIAMKVSQILGRQADLYARGG